MTRPVPKLTQARVKIMTVDPANMVIQAALKDGGAIQIAIWEVPPAWRWPVEGEVWTAVRRVNTWFLGHRVEQPNEASISELQPGDLKLDGSQISDAQGNRVVATDITGATNGQPVIWDGTGWVISTDPSVTAVGWQPGDLKAAAYSTPDPGWLLCDGSSKLRTDFPALFARITTTWGFVDGASFNVPDGRGRSLIGAGTGAGLTARALGASGGEESHLLTAAELPDHTHLRPSSQNFATTTFAAQVGGGTSFAAINASSSVTGGVNEAHGGSHNNMQPFFTGNWFIKT